MPIKKRGMKPKRSAAQSKLKPCVDQGLADALSRAINSYFWDAADCYRFTIANKPVPKALQSVRRSIIPVKRSRDYMNYIRDVTEDLFSASRSQHQDWNNEGVFVVLIEVYSKTSSRSDFDNYAKSICDGMQPHVVKNDSMIATGAVCKMAMDDGDERAEVTIWRLKDAA